MKIFSGKIAPRILSSSEAWGCFTANLSIPGAGSIAAGLKVGYLQAAVATAGFLFTCLSTFGFLRWYIPNLSNLQEMQVDDPTAGLTQLWVHGRWALLGFAIFLVAFLWSMATGLRLLHQAKVRERFPNHW